VFTNENIDAFNSQYVKQVADETDVNYLDINSYFKDETGSLPDDAASDGIHFYKGYCLEWIDLLAYLVPASANG
jgi:lysophospholipase L1-like esterase